MKEKLCAYEGCMRGDGGTRNVFTSSHSKQKYCSPECRDADHRRLCAFERCQRGPNGTRNNFTPKARHNGIKFCCTQCYADDRRGKPIDPKIVQHRKPRHFETVVIWRTCPYCTKKFQVKHKNQTFCNILHASRYNGQKRADDAKKARKSSLLSASPKKSQLTV